MDAGTRERLFGVAHAFDSPVVRGMVISLGAVLLAAPLLFVVLARTGKADEKLRRDLWDRYRSWLIFIPLMIGPVLLGGVWVIAAVGVLGIACYREFARATGLFREWLISVCVVLGIAALSFAELDHWYDFFAALMPLTIGVMAATAVLEDRPKGYIQRVALGIFAFMLFGACFGHLGYMANDPRFRPILVWLIAAVELNDIFAYISGKSFGRRKLAPHTSPNKTVGGALGALVLTTAFAALVGHWVFAGTAVDKPGHLVALGAIISVAGQFGDLTLSSLKRDLGIKDWAATFPGHGGLLDRFNSLLLAGPAVFHYVGYVKGIGLDQPRRIITGTW